MARSYSALLLELEHIVASYVRHNSNFAVQPLAGKYIFSSSDSSVVPRSPVSSFISSSVKRYQTKTFVSQTHVTEANDQSRAETSSFSSQPQKDMQANTSSASHDQKSSVPITSPTHFYRRPLPDCCVSFSSVEGMSLFAEAQASGHMFTYFPLASQFRTQDEPAFCGLSTLVMALNALEVDPQRVWKAPWRFYHENMLDCCVPLETVQQAGITMDQFACLAACNTLHVKMVRAHEENLESDFRSTVASVTQRTDQVLVVSYARSALDQTGDGHFSPVGGYHPGRDLVLIMDTARFKYPPHWVSLSRLFHAMQQTDKTSGLPRGYFILTKSRVEPAILFRLSSSLSPLVVEQNDSGVLRFLLSWQAWLLERTKEKSGVQIVRTAIKHLLALADMLNDGSFILTTHSTVSAKAEDDVEISQLAAGEGCVRRLIEFIQTLEIYHLVDSVLTNSACKSVAKFGSASIVPGLDSEKSMQVSSAVSATIDNALPLNNVEVVFCRDSVELKASHFVVMVLLSWPYHRCNRDTFGLALQRYVTTQLSAVSSQEGFELLQNEAARLRQHLSIIINYTCRMNYCCNST